LAVRERLRKLMALDSSYYVRAVLMVLLFSEMYFYPFDGGFRFSAGILILNLVVLIFDQMSYMRLSLAVGLSIVVFRSIISAGIGSMELYVAVWEHVPSMIYYVVYGVMHQTLTKKLDYSNFVLMILVLLGVDIAANCAETLVRGSIDYHAVQLIALAGLIRASLAYAFYVAIKANELYIKNAEHQKRYAQLNLLVSNIQSELFYLQKSKLDIERVMRESYDLYLDLPENGSASNKALSISREVHEIKKDYARVLVGFNAFINEFENEDAMKLKDAFKIIYVNTMKIIHSKEVKYNIQFEIQRQDNFNLKNYYAFFTMINNLIINSIESARDSMRIKVTETSDEAFVYLSVGDDGMGISEDVAPFLFNPGFTTKFDKVTGHASSGMGLSHVKSTAESLNGELSFESVPNVITKFTIKIPKEQLIRGDECEDHNDY